MNAAPTSKVCPSLCSLFGNHDPADHALYPHTDAALIVPMYAERLDFSCAIFAPNGDLIASMLPSLSIVTDDL